LFDLQLRVAFLLGTFIWPRKEKYLDRLGETGLKNQFDEVETNVFTGFRLKAGMTDKIVCPDETGLKHTVRRSRN